MTRTQITIDPEQFPSEFRPLLNGAKVYDSSSSPQARVYYIEKDGGYFLKSSPLDTLKTEAEMTHFFQTKGLAAEVLSYVSKEQDWLLTARVQGEDCTAAMYLENPKKLCDTTAELLRALHETDFSGCPVQNRTETYLDTAEKNFRAGMFDNSYSIYASKIPTAKEAWRIVTEGKSALKSDTLLHGDYCLPNVILDNWKFSGFIDVGGGGVGDRHIDLFWGAWTLAYNLKTDRYKDRFFDAYGMDKVEIETIKLISVVETFG